MITDDVSKWTLQESLLWRAEKTPTDTFVDMIGERAETYAECYQAVLGLASALRRLGVKTGDAVVVMAPNCLDAIHSWLAIVCSGGVEVTVNSAYREQPLEHALNMVKARLVIAEASLLPRIKKIAARLPHLETIIYFDAPDSPDAPVPAFERVNLVDFATLDDTAAPPARASYCDIASVVYTSGTSGPAKGVMIPHGQAYVLARQTVEGLDLTARDIYYCFHPLFHTAGKFIGLYAGMLSGAKVVFDRGFNAELWLDRIRKYGVTASLAHGAMLEMVFAQPERPEDSDNALERILASPFPRRIAEAFEKRFGVRGIEAWGMTEVNNPCWCPRDEPLRLGSCGKVNPKWADVRIVDPETDEEMPTGQIGEIVVRPTRPWTMMQGYVGMPTKTLEAWRNLWFHTGDCAYVDEEGYFYFVDRVADRIRRRAENISSYDVETAALIHPAVAECAAVGVASDYELDDDIKLCVVLREGIDFAPGDLIEHMVRILPHFMVPRYIEVLEQLPRTPTNKVRKGELRAAGVTAATWDRRVLSHSLRQIAEQAANREGTKAT